MPTCFERLEESIENAQSALHELVSGSNSERPIVPLRPWFPLEFLSLGPSKRFCDLCHRADHAMAPTQIISDGNRRGVLFLFEQLLGLRGNPPLTAALLHLLRCINLSSKAELIFRMRLRRLWQRSLPYLVTGSLLCPVTHRRLG